MEHGVIARHIKDEFGHELLFSSGHYIYIVEEVMRPLKVNLQFAEVIAVELAFMGLLKL